MTKKGLQCILKTGEIIVGLFAGGSDFLRIASTDSVLNTLVDKTTHQNARNSIRLSVMKPKDMFLHDADFIK